MRVDRDTQQGEVNEASKMTSHADSHDLDKLKRWNDGLDGEKPDEFPVHALFLVSDESKAAHDVFRKFRDRFESAGAQFHHLACSTILHSK